MTQQTSKHNIVFNSVLHHNNNWTVRMGCTKVTRLSPGNDTHAYHRCHDPSSKGKIICFHNGERIHRTLDVSSTTKGSLARYTQLRSGLGSLGASHCENRARVLLLPIIMMVQSLHCCIRNERFEESLK